LLQCVIFNMQIWYRTCMTQGSERRDLIREIPVPVERKSSSEKRSRKDFV
jgi:hypothetical protein